MKTLTIQNVDFKKVARVVGTLRIAKGYEIYRALENINKDEALIILSNLEKRQHEHRELRRHLTIEIIRNELSNLN